ncbi:MAG: hypothetical protein ACC653_09260 [Gammaproteobacteria bacterium]
MNFINTNCPLSCKTPFLILFFITSFVPGAFAESMKEDNVHVRKWNQFANDLHGLHKKQIANKKIKVKSKKGGYANNKEFYLEKEHFDEHGKLLSRIAWEVENPDKIHVIEIFVYNDSGNVVRDYSAAFLPQYRNAPVQTLISLHQYNKGLHAFRSFDASGDKILERCEGKYNGKEISFMLDEDELYELTGDENGLMYSQDYKTCFNGLQETVGKYLTPQ